MRLEDNPQLEDLLPLFDPQVVEEVNARIGAARANQTQRIDTLSGYEGASPFGAESQSDKTDWANGFASSARLNIFSRAIWLPTRAINSATNEGTQRIYNGETREFTTKIDVDEWVTENESELKKSESGQRVLRNYLAGYYDDIDDAGSFLTLIGYDQETGRQKELSDNAGFSSRLVGQALDPTIIVGGAAVRVGAGAAMRLRAGLALGESLKVTTAASRLALNGRLGAYIGENVKIGVGATLVNELGQRSVGVDALDRTFADTAIDAATGIVADSSLSMAFFGLGRGIRAGTDRLGITQPLDMPAIKERAETASKKAVAQTETETQHLWDLVSETAKQQPRPAQVVGTVDDSMNQLDALYVARTQLEQEVNGLKATVRDMQDNQLRLFDEMDLSDVQTLEIVGEQELAQIRLNQAKARLAEIRKQIKNSESLVEEQAAKGTVQVTRRKETTVEVEGEGQAPRSSEQGEEAVAQAPATEEGIFDRRVFATKEEARAASYLGAGTEDAGFLHDQVGALATAERNQIASALADPSVIDSLRNVRDAISNAETVQAADMEGDLLNALRAIENRSPNLKWNPASLGVGTVQTVKIDQPILYAETVGFVPTTPAEDILLALKKLGAFDKLEGGVSGLAPMRGGRARGRPPANIPPSLGGRYAELSTSSIEDLSLDLSNDTGQALIKKARTLLADKLNAQGLKVDPDDFSGVGLAGMASQIGTGLAYSTSRNRVTSSLYNTFFESPFVSKIYTNVNNTIPESLRVPLERVTAGISKRVSDAEEQLVRSFKGFRNKRNKGQTAITPALMSSESRAELNAFYSVIEEVRVRSNGERIPDAEILEIVQRQFPDADAKTLPIIKRLVDRMREPLPTSGRGKLNGDEIHSVRRNSTSLQLDTEASLETAVRVLRRAQELRDLDELNEETLRETLSIFSRMTDGQIPEITTADLKAALANRGGTEEDYLRQRIISLWNRRLNGVTNRQTALSLLEDPELGRSVRLDAVQSLRAYQQQAVRAEMLEKLTDYNLLLQRIEQGRGGQSATAETAFTELFARYEQLVKDFEIARAGAESGSDVFAVISVTDKLDRLLSDSIDATTTYAGRQSDRIKLPGDTPQRKSKRFQILKKEADKLNELLKSEAGFSYSGRSETTLGKIGDATLSISRSSMLSRMAISMTADPVNFASKSLAVGMARHLPRSTMLGMTRALKKVPEAERPQLMKLLTAWHDNALHNLSLGTDLGFTDLNRTVSQTSVSGLDRAVAFAENPVSRGSFFVSGGKWLDSTLRQGGTIQALSELTDPKGLIRRLAKALDNAEPGESLLDTLKRAKQDSNYSSYAHILRFLSREDIKVLSEAIDSGRYEIATSQGRFFGEAKIKFLSPVDEGAAKEVQAQQARALSNLANLTDSWVEFRSMTVPHAVDRPRARGDSQTFLQRVGTQFMSAGLAAGRTVALQTNNDHWAKRAFFMGVAVATAVAVRALRSVIKGDDERYLKEIEEEPLLVLADAIGWSGVAGIVGDKAFPTIATFFLGDNAAYDSRRSLDFAITTPLQAYGKRAFAAFTGFRDLATGEEPSSFERRAMRNVFSAGLLDSTLTDFLLIGADATRADELPGVEEAIDFLYSDLEEKEGLLKKALE